MANKGFNWKEYKPTGVRAVDMVAACIAWHREKGLPIKALHVKPAAFEQVEYYFRKLLGDEYEGICWDAVNIDKGSVLQANTIVVEFYTAIPAEA